MASHEVKQIPIHMKQAGLSMLSCSKELHPKKQPLSKETITHRAFTTQLL